MFFDGRRVAFARSVRNADFQSCMSACAQARPEVCPIAFSESASTQPTAQPGFVAATSNAVANTRAVRRCIMKKWSPRFGDGMTTVRASTSSRASTSAKRIMSGRANTTTSYSKPRARSCPLSRTSASRIV